MFFFVSRENLIVVEGKKKANEKEKAKIEKDKPEKKENGKSDRETTTNSDTRGISPPEGECNSFHEN